MSPAREERRDDLLVMLIGSQTGLTIDDMMTSLRASHPQVNDAIHDARLWLGEFDEVNLVCEPQGAGDRWIYRIVGSLDEARWWANNRVDDAHSRIETVAALLASIVKATDGRSLEGRKARIMERSLRRLIEDIETMMTEATRT